MACQSWGRIDFGALRRPSLLTLRRIGRLLPLLFALPFGFGLVEAGQNAVPIQPSEPGIVTGPSLKDAEHLYRTGRLDEAIGEYTQAALAYAGLTRVYLQKKDPAHAYAAAAKAMELEPDSADAKTAQGEAYFRQGKIGEAEAMFVSVINSGANNPRAYWGLARTSGAISYYAREKRLIDKAHALDPADPDITRDWIATLPMAEQTKELKNYLAQTTNDDADTRKQQKQALDLMEHHPPQPCKMTGSVESSETDLRMMLQSSNELTGYGLDVKVNGVMSHLLLDTGADGILITKRAADKAGVKKLIDIDLPGIGDKSPSRGYIGHADKVQIGMMEFRDCEVFVFASGSFSGEGLIGPAIFSDFLVDIDMPQRKFRLSQLPARPGEKPSTPSLGQDPDREPIFYDRYVAPEMKSYTPVYRFDHMLLIPTLLNGAVTKLFLIDSGAFDSTLTPEAAGEVTHVSSNPDVEITGFSGAVKKVYRGDELTLTFGGLRQSNQDINAFDNKSMSDGAGTEISGIIGFPLLLVLDMKIDYRDGLVSFRYDAKRFP